MTPKFRQFRYFGDNSLQNNINKQQLIDGNVFTEEIKAISQLGVRALPGTKLYINNNNNPIIIGYIGVFELDLTGKSSITSLKIDEQSISAINNNLQGGYIIIDILGLGGD